MDNSVYRCGTGGVRVWIGYKKKDASSAAVIPFSRLFLMSLGGPTPLRLLTYLFTPTSHSFPAL